MLEVLRENGEIVGVCEYFVVDKQGKIDDNGEYAWIAECEINESKRGQGYLGRFIEAIAYRFPNTKYGYFWRKMKYPQRSPRIYSRRQWLNLVK